MPYAPPYTESARISTPDPININKQAFAKLSAARKRELQDLLKAINREVDRNPLVSYVPHPKQKLFHAAKQRTRMFHAGSRTGKSTAGVADDLIQALPLEFVPEHLRPYKKFGFDTPFKGRVITPDLGHTMEAVLEKFREMCPKEALKGGSWDDAFDTTKRILRFVRGDVVDFMSFEQGKDKFGGLAKHRIHFDEEPQGPNSWAIYRDSNSRLIDYGGDMIFTMTPLGQTEWVKEKVWEARLSHPEEIFAIQASMRDNPHLPQAEIDRRLRDLSKEELAVIEGGEFRYFEGAFYDEFTEGIHTVPPPHPDEVQDWEIVVGIDPGRRTGVVWVGFDGDNRALVFDELYPYDELPPQIAVQIKAKNDHWGVSPSYVIDPAARIRSGPNQEQFTTAYAREGIMVAEGQNARGPGITEIKRRLQQQALYVSKECRNLIWEFPNYRRKPDSQDEWEAVKINDHLLDALRYGVMSKTWVIPKLAPTRNINNFNNPKFEPPWRGPVPTDNPPLGVMS